MHTRSGNIHQLKLTNTARAENVIVGRLYSFLPVDA